MKTQSFEKFLSATKYLKVKIMYQDIKIYQKDNDRDNETFAQESRILKNNSKSEAH